VEALQRWYFCSFQRMFWDHARPQYEVSFPGYTVKKYGLLGRDRVHCVPRLPRIWLNIRAFLHILANPSSYIIKGTVSRDFFIHVFSRIMFPQAPRYTIGINHSCQQHRCQWQFATSTAGVVDLTLVANLPLVSAALAAKFAAGCINDTADK
jgi:hypothetical protein